MDRGPGRVYKLAGGRYVNRPLFWDDEGVWATIDISVDFH